MRKKVGAGLEKWLKRAEEQTAQVVDADAIYSASFHLVVGVFWIVAAAFIYAYVVFVLAAFPYTRGLANALTDYAAAPIIGLCKSFVYYLPNLMALAFIVILARYVNKLMRILFENIAKGIIRLEQFEREWVRPTYNIFRVVLIIVTVMICYPFIPGSGTDAFKGISIFVGVLVSIGGTSIFSNMLASLVVT